MLSIGKLGHGQERYYLEAVAEGAEDYYLFSGEAPGRWGGGGSRALGLPPEQAVQGEQFTALLRGHDPRTGAALGTASWKVPGFDLTFSAPKSVSLLFALGDPEVSRRMREAHDAAVDDALGYLERTAAYGRRGHGGAERISTSGFVAAAFRHRTSRAGDPNLHTHVVVANRVQGADGRWSALDARAVYAQAKTAGTLYEASLRAELRDLGLSWTVPANGLAEIDGVPAQVRRAFSQRRQQIEKHLAQRGLTSARAAQVATLQTREAKDHVLTPETMLRSWRRRADEFGFTAEAIEELLERGRQRAHQPPARPEAALGRLLGPQGLTAHASTFGERDALRGVANALPDGGRVAEVEALTERLLASPAVVSLVAPHRKQDVIRLGGDGHRLVPLGASEWRSTTAELLAVEQRLVERAQASQGAHLVRAEDSAVEAALARRPHLNGEQAQMVRALCTSGHGVDVVNAAAGSGKTTALDAVTEAFAASGVPVLGTTLSAKAAGVLSDETGMTTYTTTRLLLDLADPRSGGLPQGAVLVVDEAGQVGTRVLAELQAHVVRAQGKLVLVGDVRQLPEIDAGGAFRGLVNRLPVIELDHNHRQRDDAERARLRELRSGDVREAMTSYDEAGRVTRAETSEALRQELVSDWARAALSTADPSGVVMLGLTNADVEDLNERARAALLAAGQLDGRGVVLGGRSFAAGDRVVTRHNDYRLGVLNGQRWTVRQVDLEGQILLLQREGSDEAVKAVPFAYAEVGDGRLQHAYALTVTLSQGSTFDETFILGSDATYREAGYTAASRARERTQFYVVAGRDEDDHVPPRRPEGDPLEATVEALQRSAAQSLAIDW